MKLMYGCEYCDFISSKKNETMAHEADCKIDHDLINFRKTHMVEYVRKFEENFTFENILQCVNDYVKAMYNDHFSEIRVVNFKFRDKVSREAQKPQQYNHPVWGDCQPGFTGQITGKKSRKGKTLMDYPELGFILDSPSISVKSWNSAFRLFAADFDQLADIIAKAYLKVK